MKSLSKLATFSHDLRRSKAYNILRHIFKFSDTVDKNVDVCC